jgi:hypothetical protein
MVVVPSYDPHMVFSRAGNGPRISISFKLGNEPYSRRAQVVTEHMTFAARPLTPAPRTCGSGWYSGATSKIKIGPAFLK